MDEQTARAILGDTIREDNVLDNLGHYTFWPDHQGLISLDCQFSADELEAMAWWMRNKVWLREDDPRQLPLPFTGAN